MPFFLTVKKTFENTALVLKKFGKQLIQGKKKEINNNVKFLKVGRSIHFKNNRGKYFYEYFILYYEFI